MNGEILNYVQENHFYYRKLYFLSIFFPLFFYYSLPIIKVLKFGIWGEVDPRINNTEKIYVPEFESQGLSHELSIIINYVISYTFIFSIIIIFLYTIFKIFYFLFHTYNNLLNETKTERKFKKTKLDQLVYILSLILIILFILGHIYF